MGMKGRGAAYLTAILTAIAALVFTGCPDGVEKPQQRVYSVTVQTGIPNGTISASSASSAAGEVITLTLTPNKDYSLKELSVKQTNETEVQTNGYGRTRTFTMPASNVTISGEFEEFDESPLTNNNNITVLFKDFYDEDIDLTQDHTHDLAIGTGQTLYMEVPEGYDKYYWIVNGESWSGLRFFILTMDTDIWGANTIGRHTITAVVQKGDISYSKNLTFRVVW